MASYDFRIVRPVEMTDATLTSSNVPETVAATYAGGTTYDTGDRAGLAPVDGQAQLVYESLSDGNIGNPLPVPPATSTAFWRYVASVYPEYSGAVTYALGDVVSSIATDTHLLYESLAAGNLGNALTDTTKWLHIGSPKVTTGEPYNSTNRWKMFDQSYTSQTENAESIEVTITPGAVVNTAAFLNVSAQSIRVEQPDTGYDETVQMRSHLVDNWYDYWYEDLTEEDEALFLSIPPSPSSAITVTISAPGSTARCGVMVVGKEKMLGETQWGMSKEILDYSRVTENDFGDVQLTRGKYSERLYVDVYLTPGTESDIVRTLKAHRSEPLVFVGSTEFTLSIVYGFLGAWRVPCEITGGLMPIEIKGLS